MADCLSELTMEEIRGWVTLLFVIVGAVVALKTYSKGQSQRRIENSFRLIDQFNRAFDDADIDKWRTIFHAASEPAGASPGFFVIYNGIRNEERSFAELFSEGPPDEGVIERMAEYFDLLGFEAIEGNVELRVLYFEFGQLMRTVYSWLTTVTLPHHTKSLVRELYPSFAALFEDGHVKREWPSKTYEHIG